MAKKVQIETITPAATDLFTGPFKAVAGQGGGTHMVDPIDFPSQINRWIWEYGIGVIASRASAGMRVVKAGESPDSKTLFADAGSLALAISGLVSRRFEAMRKGEWSLGGGGRPVTDPVEAETWTLVGNALRAAGLSTEKLKALSMADNVERVIRARTPGVTDSTKIRERAESIVAGFRAKAAELVASRKALESIDLSDLA